MTQPVVVGSAARDVTPDDPRGWRLGGAAAYCGLTLARLGMRPRVIIGVDAAASGAEELRMLRAAGADVHVVRLESGPVFRNRGLPEHRIQDCLEPGTPLEPVVPAAWADAAAWMLVPVADELLDDWADLPATDAFVAVGWQGLLRNLPRGGVVSRRDPRPSAIVRRADLIGLSRDDVAASTTLHELSGLLRAPARLLLTDGAAGGLIRQILPDEPSRTTRYPAIPAARLVDATGAGDTFLAALVAARLGHPLGGSGRRGSDLRLAAAVASLTVEAPGLRGVPGLDDVSARLRASLGPVHAGAAPAADADPA
jgi:sugar/nucleoside kinase (ribokinase family)